MKHTLYIAQKPFKLFGQYTIQNEEGTTLYTVQGKAGIARNQTIYDQNEQSVGQIIQKIRFGLPRFELKLHDKPVGTIQQKLSLKTKLDLDYYGWSVQGDLLGWNYEIYDQTNTLLAKIQPEHWHLSDHYALHYEHQQDELPLLLLALAIDCIKDAAQH